MQGSKGSSKHTVNKFPSLNSSSRWIGTNSALARVVQISANVHKLGTGTRAVWNHCQYSSPIWSEFIRDGPGQRRIVGWDDSGRGAAGPGRRCTTTAAGALRVIARDGSVHMSCHAPPQVPIGNGVAGGPESVRDR